MQPFCNVWVMYMILLRSKVGYSSDANSANQLRISADGKFGAMMSIALTNDGPVTFIVDSRSQAMDSSLSDSPCRQPGKSATQAMTAAQRTSEKALRKVAWEEAKKQTDYTQTRAFDANSSQDQDNTAQ
jgi:hypothetical protein